MNELDRLLALATEDPAFEGPFYRALLDNEVYALVLKGDRPSAGARVRFVMWLGEDGAHVVPFFSNRAILRRALKPEWESLRLHGRTLLDGCRGTTVVLNPNEALFCRLNSSEIGRLLDTGSPDGLRRVDAQEGMTLHLAAPDASETLIRALRNQLAQSPEVQCAYLLTCNYPAPSESAWLVAVIVDPEFSEEPVATGVADLARSMDQDGLLSRPVDLTRLRTEASLTAKVKDTMRPIYVRNATLRSKHGPRAQ